MLDFTNRNVCKKYVSDIRKKVIDKFGIDISKYVDLSMIAERMY